MSFPKNVTIPLLVALLLSSCGGSGSGDMSGLLMLGSTNEQRPATRVELTLFDINGQPLRNTLVHYSEKAGASSLVNLSEVRTSNNGELSLYLPEGFYTFEVFSLDAGFELFVVSGQEPFFLPIAARSGYIEVAFGLHGYPASGGSGNSGGEPGGGDGGDTNDPDPQPIYRSISVFTSGLEGTATVRNQFNNETIQIRRNGYAAFPTTIEDGTSYNISLVASPSEQVCSLKDKAGYVSMSMPVVRLECSTPEPLFTVSGVVEGLYRDIYLGLSGQGEYIRIWNDDGSDKSFSFRTELKAGESYDIVIPAIPYNFSCEIENGSGTITDHDIQDVRVVCTEPQAPVPPRPVEVSTLDLEGISYLYGIDYSPNGYLYLSHNGENVIEVHPDTGQTRVVLQEGPENGNPEFDTISGITVAPDGTIFLNDTEFFTTYRISTRYEISVFLDQYVAFTAFDLDVGPDGYVYIADYGNERILKVDQEGNFTVLAQLDHNPMGLIVGEDGAVYFTVAQISNVYKLKHGVVSRLAGADGCGFMDGTGVHGYFCNPDGLAMDPDGNIIVADRFNNAIRRVTPDGVVTTVAGTGEEGSRDGSGSEATFSSPRRVTTLPDGRIAVTARQGAIRIIRPVDGLQ
ncbi:MAG: hypothetical protein KDK25_02660 [Leptospiraceae bacterium]|nr:hypothetical protein [Leptospiraceae bacterium]